MKIKLYMTTINGKTFLLTIKLFTTKIHEQEKLNYAIKI